MASESTIPILVGSAFVGIVSGIISLLPKLSWVGLVLWSPVWISFSLSIAFLINLAVSYGLDRINGIELEELRKERSGRAFQTPPFATPAALEAARIKARWSKSSTKSPGEAEGWTKGDHLPTAVQSILAYVRRDYILPWYGRISDAPAFPDAIETLIASCVLKIGDRVANVDLPDLIVSKLLPQITEHLSEYRKVEHLLRSTSGFAQSSSHPNTTLPSTTVDPTAIIQSHFPSLHHSLPASSLSNTLPTVEAHLRSLIGPALKLLFPEEERKSDAVMIVATELVTCVVAVQVVELLSDPDFWNRILDEQAGKYIEERKQVSQLRAALDSSTSTARGATPRKRSSHPPMAQQAVTLPPRTQHAPAPISSSTDAKDFDVFLRSIGKVKSVAEAKRLRWDIEREVRVSTAEMEDGDAGGKKSDERNRFLKAHVQRLEEAKRKVDRKLAALNGMSSKDLSASFRPADEVGVVLLKDILTNPASLGYFLEFMERRQQSRLAQFWMMVESFKNPLEDMDSSEEGELAETKSLNTAISNVSWITARDDLEMMWAGYLADEAPGGRIELSEKVVKAVRDFVIPTPLEDGRGAIGSEDRRLAVARKAIFQGQREVYNRILEDHYPAFQRSELYVKAAAEIKRTALMPSVSSSSLPVDSRTVRPGLKQGHTSPPAAPYTAWLPFGINNSKPGKRILSTSSSAGGSSPRSVADEEDTPRREFRRGKTAEPSSPAPSAPAPLFKSRSMSFESSPGSQISGSSPRPSMPTNRALDFLVGSTPSKNAKPLFGPDEPEEGISKESLDVLRADGRAIDEDEEYVQIERMEAIQAALTSIIHMDDMRQRGRPMDDSFYAESDPGTDAGRDQSVFAPKDLMTKSLDSSSFPPFIKRKPISLVDTASSTEAVPEVPPKATEEDVAKPVAPVEKSMFDDREDSVEPSETIQEEDDFTSSLTGQIAVPGDLHLGKEIARIGEKVSKLADQDEILDKLIRAAELTGKQHELSLLVRSQKDLRRESRALNFQRSQFEQQEKDNRLVPGRTRITVPRAFTADQAGEKNVTRYLIEIQQYGDDGHFLQGWIIARRYNEFWDLNQDLKESYTLGSEMRQRNIDLPGKRLVTAMSSSFVDERRTGLETYLQNLASLPIACRHPAFLAFLSRSHAAGESGLQTSLTRIENQPKNVVKSLFRSVTTSLDDIFLGPSMLDVLSDRLNRQTMGMAEEIGAGLFGLGAKGLETMGFDVGGAYGSSINASGSRSNLPRPFVRDEEDMLKVPLSMKPLDEEAGVSSFTAPICDLFIELFDLKESNWLRKQAIVVIMQQILGGAIERKIREAVRASTSASAVDRYIQILCDIMWPGGERRPPSVPRTAEEKLKTQTRAARKMQTLMPDLATNMIGRSNARRATQRAFSSIQAKILCQHLVLTFIDQVFAALFPEIQAKAHPVI